MTFSGWAALAAITITLFGVAVGRYPWLRMNRATIALVGAVALVILGAITLDQAYAALDLNTLALLFSMMILNANLRLAGFFRLVGRRVVRWARTPRQLLALIILASGVLSALFLNDTIVLMFTPLVLEITLSLKRNPIPYLVGLVAAANLGSTATITGNPQNMLIGSASGIPYLTFTGTLAPVALAGMALAWVVLVLVYRAEFAPVRLNAVPELGVRLFRPMLFKSLAATAGMLAALIAGVPVALAALAAASALLITRRIKPQRIFREVDFSLLVFFSGLFIVTGAIETSGWGARLFDIAQPIARLGIGPLAGVAVVLSNLVSNVPAVLLFRPLVPHFPAPQQAWLTLAMATTFAGNLTLLGSVANLIVAEQARERGVHLSFGEYLKAGVPITLLSLVLGVGWLSLVLS
jgi:Na+/H+ antiporter NhaD/arsenite permease-like protein